ncbi:MAG: choice-of-anchor tandem repeat GloVer-containing protein [Verrucomicrobiia bacterium]
MKNFYGPDPNDGRNPSASLVQGSDGALYGTTQNGGTYGLGTVFALDLDGTGYTVLYHFGAFPNDGAKPSASLVLGSDGALYGTTAEGGNLGAGTAFRLSFPGVIRSLSPASAFANGPDFLLTVSGPYFEPGSTVLWNGASRETVGSDDGTQLHATIPASDLASSSDIETAVITVLDPEGCASDPQLFAVVSANVSSQQSAMAPPNEVVVLATSNISDQGQELAVSACVDNVQGSESVAVTTATFAGNPTSSNVFDVGGGYVDLKVCGGDEHVSVASRFYYPSTVTGEAEENLTLLYYTGTSWAPVLSSSGVAPWQETEDNLEGTISGGCFYVIFDQTSTPKVTELSGTVFSPALLEDTVPPQLTAPGNFSIPCSSELLVPVTFTATATDNCDPSPSLSCSPPSGSGFPVGETLVVCTATDASGNASESSFTVTRAALGFVGFLMPIGGADGTGGSPASPVRTFKNGSTIPVKFIASSDGAPVLTGVHRLEVIKYSNATTAAMPIDASPQDAATTGSQFRPVDGQWHFNLDTKGSGLSVGMWLLRATLSDTSQHSVWVQLK